MLSYQKIVNKLMPLKKLTRNMKYQICTKTVMDTSDSRIAFDSNGVCDHALDFYKNVMPNWHTGEVGKNKLASIVNKIKVDGKNRDFDCILGLSGGVDSSYMLHLAVKEFGLRPLVFHVDGGWNSELAVHNIQVMVDRLNLDLYTEVINWEEMKEFQLAWLKSGVPHIDIPQDHAFIATLYKFAEKYNIKYILNGGNISTECVRNPLEFFYYGTDILHINDILNKFSNARLKTYPFSSIFRHKIYLRFFRGIKVIRPLNYRPYIKSEAVKILQQEYEWRPYPQKHFESRFTRFYEGYWLPKRFGFDPRRVQFSSLILTGQMTRSEAIRELEMSSYDSLTINQEFEYIATKLGITVNELEEYFHLPKKFYWNYKNMVSIFNMGAKILKKVGFETSIKR